MPIYVYRCGKCDKSLELLQKMGADAPLCPDCAVPTKKQVARTSFALRGSGWASDNYGLKGD